MTSWRNQGWNAEDAMAVENSMIGFLRRNVKRAQRYERCSDQELGIYRVGFYFQGGEDWRSGDCLMIYDVVESSLSVCRDGASVNMPPTLHNYFIDRFKEKEFARVGRGIGWKGFSLEEIKNL